MIRTWVKYLPLIIVEKIVLKQNSIFCKLDGNPVEAYEIRDGMFLVKSQKRVLLERKWELERELDQIEKRIGDAVKDI